MQLQKVDDLMLVELGFKGGAFNVEFDWVYLWFLEFIEVVEESGQSRVGVGFDFLLFGEVFADEDDPDHEIIAFWFGFYGVGWFFL